MTQNSAFSGAYDKNPFAFKHFSLEFLALYRDGVQIPPIPFQPEYENGSSVRDFYQLVLSTRRHLKNQPLAMDRLDFLNGYTLYGRGSQSLHSKVRIGIIINVKKSEIIVITILVFTNMFITLYNSSTWYMLNYHISDVIRSYFFRSFTKMNHKKTNKQKKHLVTIKPW